MAKKVRIKSPKVAEPPPHSWSPALRVGDHVYIAGQVAVNSKGKSVGRADALAQGRQVFRNIKALVEQAGGSMEDLVKITVYLTDIRHSEEVRQARNEFIKGEPPTSTLLVVTALASPDFLVEIDAVAVLTD